MAITDKQLVELLTIMSKDSVVPSTLTESSAKAMLSALFRRPDEKPNMSKFRKGNVVKIKLANGKVLRGILTKHATGRIVDILCEGVYDDQKVVIDSAEIDGIEQIDDLNIFDVLREKGVIA